MSQNKKKQSLEQTCAGYAWNCIEECAQLPSEDDRLDYIRAARRLPLRIMASGLGQAVAFLEAKKEKGSGNGKEKLGVKKLIDHLEGWILDHRLGRGKVKENACLISCLIQNEPMYMRRAANEAITWLQWLNRFAEGRFGIPDMEEKQE